MKRQYKYQEPEFPCIVAIFFVVFFSFGIYFCRIKPTALHGAKHPCVVIEKGFNYAIKIQCQDTIYHFTDKKYYETLNEGDTIKAQ